jgi:alkanesulfonate monooxygenase SsuD/methylene tetrahydromethanopterin reductase-like flavin-dependent oxidoreductase (luciferase family)
MRECIGFIRTAIRGDAVPTSEDLAVFGGRPVSLARDFNWSPWGGFEFARDDIPIHVGTRGPLMLRVAAELADGLILENNLPAIEIRNTVSRFREATVAVGRSPDEAEISGIVLFSPSEDGAVDPSWRSYFAAICPPMRRVDADTWGYDWDQISAVADAWMRGDEHEAARLVPDRMIEDMVITGTKVECIQRLLEYRGLGAVPIVMPEACSLRLAIEVGAEYAAVGY